jgi:predicted ferric reductase
MVLSAAVILGLVTKTRWATQRWPRFVTGSLHRNISLLSIVFMVVHIASSVLDTYVNIRWMDAIVPFGGAYKPFWLGLGALSLDLFLAVALTSLFRARLGYRMWKGVHWMAYGCWVLAIAHNLGIGSDRHQTWLLIINLVAVTAVAAALGWRVLAATRPNTPDVVVAAHEPGHAPYRGALS